MSNTCTYLFSIWLCKAKHTEPEQQRTESSNQTTLRGQNKH